LRRHLPQRKKRDEILAEAAAAAIEVLFEMHGNRPITDRLPAIEFVREPLDVKPVQPLPGAFHSPSRQLGRNSERYPNFTDAVS
jgi:hypothetical protein